MLIQHATVHLTTRINIERFFDTKALGVECTPKRANCRCGRCPIGGKSYTLKEERNCWVAQYPWIRDPKRLPENKEFASRKLKATEKNVAEDVVVAEKQKGAVNNAIVEEKKNGKVKMDKKNKIGECTPKEVGQDSSEDENSPKLNAINKLNASKLMSVESDCSSGYSDSDNNTPTRPKLTAKRNAKKEESSSDSSDDSFDEEDQKPAKVSTGKKRKSDDDNNNSFAKKVKSDKHTVLVGNIAFDAKQDELKNGFEEKGLSPTGVRILTQDDGKSKGFGYVDFTSKKEREIALELSGTEFYGLSGNGIYHLIHCL